MVGMTLCTILTLLQCRPRATHAPIVHAATEVSCPSCPNGMLNNTLCLSPQATEAVWGCLHRQCSLPGALQTPFCCSARVGVQKDDAEQRVLEHTGVGGWVC